MLGILPALLLAIGLGSQSAFGQDIISPGASGLAPGVVDSQHASTISPGALEKAVIGSRLPPGGCIASINSPGILFRQEPTTDTSP
jgi:hypothetical protein